MTMTPGGRLLEDIMQGEAEARKQVLFLKNVVGALALRLLERDKDHDHLIITQWELHNDYAVTLVDDRESGGLVLTAENLS